MLDGDITTFWHSRWSQDKAVAPHWVAIDFGEERDVAQVRLTPRQDGSNGRAREYEFYLSQDGQNWGNPVLKGTLPDSPTRHSLKLDTAHRARHLKLVILSDYSSGGFGTIAEIDINPQPK